MTKLETPMILKPVAYLIVSLVVAMEPSLANTITFNSPAIGRRRLTSR